MTTATEITESVQDGVLKAIEVGQRIAVEAVSTAAATVDGMVPARTVAPLSQGPMTLQEVIDTTFRFTSRLLDSQKAFLSELTTVATPSTTANGPAKKTTGA